MNNPGVRTLYMFLITVKSKSPSSFSQICGAKNSGYGMVSRYIDFCLEHDLITVVEERKTRGRYPSKLYGLTESGSTFLDTFTGLESGQDESTDGQ